MSKGWKMADFGDFTMLDEAALSPRLPDAIDILVADMDRMALMTLRNMANESRLQSVGGERFKRSFVAEKLTRFEERMHELRAWTIPAAVTSLGQFCEKILENQEKLGLNAQDAVRYRDVAEKCAAIFRPDAEYAHSKTNQAYLIS